jgi:cystathionine beta-lyase/cystathionine gamma-synthase
MGNPARRIETAVVHAGSELKVKGALVLPIFQSSTYLYSGQSDYEDLKYIRLSNTPNHEALGAKLAALEGGESALVMASGMAAISTTLLSILSMGDHLLIQDCTYGGTRDLVSNDFPALGIQVDFIDPLDPNSWRDKLRPETKAIFVESISNPLMQIGDLGSAVEFAKKNGLVSLIDNTFATPVNFRPLEHGFDLVLHSCTKYLNGHSDIVAGAVVGGEEMVKNARSHLLRFGGSMDPHTCFLLDRGLKTLVLRVRQQNESARQIAHFLADHERIGKVNYPGLPDASVHQETARLFSGFGGMLSFEVAGGLESARRFIDGLNIAVEAPSLGGVETLATRPATTSHSGLPAAEREELGITESLIRLTVGIEAVDDLLEDLDQALSGCER